MPHFFILVDHAVTQVDFETWIAWTLIDANRIVEQTYIEPEECVSTVFLPWTRDHFYFESRVFGGRFNSLTAHYQTWDEAKAGHTRIVAKLVDGTVD